MLTNITNRKQDVGDPCLTPIDAVIVVEPRILVVTLYIDIRAKLIVTPHPRLFKTLNSFPFGPFKVNNGNIQMQLLSDTMSDDKPKCHNVFNAAPFKLSSCLLILKPNAM